MQILRPLALLLTSALLSLSVVANEALLNRTEFQDKAVLGRIEFVKLLNIEGLSEGIPGKIDTGADTTSMHAENIHIDASGTDFAHYKDLELMKKLGDVYGEKRIDENEQVIEATVHFDLLNPYTGERVKVKRPLTRLSIITSRGEGFLYRPVVEIPMEIGGVEVLTEVNLTDRSSFSYPILIGKTYLREVAWVDSAFDYLQQQNQAQVIGKKQSFWLGEAKLASSISFANRYTIIHAEQYQVSKDQQVSFSFTDDQGKQQQFTLPLVRELKVSGNAYPMVYLPLRTSADSDESVYVLSYLKDRSKFSSQLRLGTEALNQYFAVDLSQNHNSTSGESLQQAASSANSLMVSSLEHIQLDDITLKAEPSLVVQTPLLKANSLAEQDEPRLIRAELRDSSDTLRALEAKIERRIRVGDEVRPVIHSKLSWPGVELERDIALSLTDEGEEAALQLGADFVEGRLLVNTRAEHLLSKQPLRPAGYIEQAQVEGRSIAVKLDTGADVSSMHAEDVELFDKDGKQWVRFNYRDTADQLHPYERKVQRIMKIKARKGEKANIRPVVMMNVKLGEIEQETAVNLQDRSNFSYRMILGKNFLNQDIIVSSKRQYLMTKEASN